MQNQTHFKVYLRQFSEANWEMLVLTLFIKVLQTSTLTISHFNKTNNSLFQDMDKD